MNTLTLRITAPFAAFWAYTTGFRRTSRVMPPSTAYGFVMNLVGGESHLDGASVELAVGLVRHPQASTKFELLQQLHVPDQQPNKGKTFLRNPEGDEVKGFKSSIQPIRREFLYQYDGVIAVRAPDHVLDMVRRGVGGEGDSLFLGDSDCLAQDVKVGCVEAYWYERAHRTSRWLESLTLRTDPIGGSRASKAVFTPVDVPSSVPPDTAWISWG